MVSGAVNGCSVRLVKESTSLTHGQTGTYVGNDGRTYKTICIGNQEWLAEDLAETKFKNGDFIPLVPDATDWSNTVDSAMCYYENVEDNAFETGTAPYSEHDHDERYYTETEVDTKLSGKSDTGHSHDGDYAPISHSHDDRYYTETETDNLLAGKSDIGHNHDADYDPNGAAASHVSTHENAFDHSKLHDHANKSDLDNYDPANFVGANDTRLTDAREWTASEITQAEAEAGTATTPRKWTAQRVKQAIEALAGTGGDISIDGGRADEVFTNEQVINGGGA